MVNITFFLYYFITDINCFLLIIIIILILHVLFGLWRNVVLLGIPAADLKEHERQKAGGRDDSDDDDEPAAKKIKPEGLLGTAPGVIPGMVPGMMPPHPGLPGMTPGIPMGPMMSMNPMAPHFMHPGYVFFF